MEDSVTYKYILFPLPLLQEIITDPKSGFNDVFYYGIYRSSLTGKIDFSSAVRQVLYCYYRGGLTDWLYDYLNELSETGTLNIDEDVDAFQYDGTFAPVNAINELVEYDEPLLKQGIIEFYRLFQIKKVLDLTFDIEKAISVYQDYNEMYDDFKEQPLVLISTRIMVDYTHNPKSEYENILFAAYAGIRSIIGKNDFAYTTKEYIVCRMLGVKSPQYLKKELKDRKLKAIHQKYSKRYQIDKILNTLVDRKLMVKLAVPQLRRIYISTRLTLPELSEAIYKSFAGSQKQRITKAKKEERNEAQNLFKRLSQLE